MFPLVLGETLVILLDIFTAYGQYAIEYCQNLPLPIQMQLSKKWKYFPQFFVPLIESTSNFKHFEKKTSWSLLIYFPNYRLEKLRQATLYKVSFLNTLWQPTCESAPNTCEISMRPLLSCVFIILREVDLENISCTNKSNLRYIS